jgi:hypothetical protein
LTTGAAPQELVDQIRENMEPAEQNAATDGEPQRLVERAAASRCTSWCAEADTTMQRRSGKLSRLWI